MKNDMTQNVTMQDTDKPAETPLKNNQINRRKFVEVMASSAVAFTIVPRHVLGGKDYVAPSDKINLAYIGIGTQGIRELLPMLAYRKYRSLLFAIPAKNAIGYKDWAKGLAEK